MRSNFFVLGAARGLRQFQTSPEDSVRVGSQRADMYRGGTGRLEHSVANPGLQSVLG